VRIATWNLNTWINRKNGISNETSWEWAEENIDADVVIFTEAATPPPASVKAREWSVAHRPGGFPGRSQWGTLIASRTHEVELITHVGHNHRLGSLFPGSLTAVALKAGKETIACLVGLYLPYRKDARKEFIGHPIEDLRQMKQDFEAIVGEFGDRVIVAGDLNFPYGRVPDPLHKLGFVDPFAGSRCITYRQDWNVDGLFTMDFVYVSGELSSSVTEKSGGIDDFPTAFDVSDHAPVVIDIEF
jgi:exonuclease III